jgi:carbamate kinase
MPNPAFPGSESVVVALGGNALLPKEEMGEISGQLTRTRAALKPIIELVRSGYRLALTHGNGPQVGSVLVRNEAARGKTYELPLNVAVAATQGEIGYVLMRVLQNLLAEARIGAQVVTLLTQIVVDPNDPRMQNAVKGVGPYLSEEAAALLRAQGAVVTDDAGRGLRRKVPSPLPKTILELETVKRLLGAGHVVICCGGGGVPVARHVQPDGSFRHEGIDAVIDKDYASAALARDIGADRLVIITGVEAVQTGFGTPNARRLDRITPGEVHALDANKEFADGSMRPKVLAAADFVESTGRSALITDYDNLTEALLGRAGTHVVPKL